METGIMRKMWWLILLAAGVVLLNGPRIPVLAQAQDTQAPTVTGTPTGPVIMVPDEINVRLGPSLEFDQVGVLISGQEAVALGRSPGGDWIQIVYFGVEGNKAWVYAPFIRLSTGQGMLPIVEPPSTPTPRVIATIDPTFAAQFNMGDSQPTRLPTFTPAPAVIYPTFEPVVQGNQQGIPPIMAILGLLLIGTFGMVAAVLRR